MDFDFSADPFQQLNDSVATAAGKGLKDANAMALATASRDGKPSVRIVLYKGIVRGGLSFYTNYQGRKGRELLENPYASVCFYWPTLDQQVRVEGRVAPLTREESEAYFRTRHRLSQLGAWASDQSQEIPNLEALQKKVEAFDEQFRDQEVPCPPHWGGFHLVPDRFEFWFGREGRLHERYCYEKADAGLWRRVMRSP